MKTDKLSTEQTPNAQVGTTSFSATEYAEIHDQRMALIRPYNIWFSYRAVISIGREVVAL